MFSPFHVVAKLRADNTPKEFWEEGLEKGVSVDVRPDTHSGVLPSLKTCLLEFKTFSNETSARVFCETIFDEETYLQILGRHDSSEGEFLFKYLKRYSNIFYFRGGRSAKTFISSKDGVFNISIIERAIVDGIELFFSCKMIGLNLEEALRLEYYDEPLSGIYFPNRFSSIDLLEYAYLAGCSKIIPFALAPDNYRLAKIRVTRPFFRYNDNPYTALAKIIIHEAGYEHHLHSRNELKFFDSFNKSLENNLSEYEKMTQFYSELVKVVPALGSFTCVITGKERESREYFSYETFRMPMKSILSYAKEGSFSIDSQLLAELFIDEYVNILERYLKKILSESTAKEIIEYAKKELYSDSFCKALEEKGAKLLADLMLRWRVIESFIKKKPLTDLIKPVIPEDSHVSFL